MKKILYFITLSLLVVGSIVSCRDSDLEPTLAQAKDLETSINNTEDLNSILSATYDRMSQTAYYGRDIIIYGEVRSDNAYSNANSNRFVTVGQMKMVPADAYPSDTWTQIYRAIATANIIINKPESEIKGDVSEIKHIKGQAYAVRALAHFDLVRLFGQQHVNGGGMSSMGVPYVKTFKDVNSLLPARNTVQEVYNFAKDDLAQAVQLMNPSLDDPSKHYMTSQAANAILARMALYFDDTQTAEAAALKVINSQKYSISTAANFASTFNSDSRSNVIFSISATSNDNMGINGLANIYRGASYGDVVILKDLFDKYTTGDVRGTSTFIQPRTVAATDFRNIGKYPTMGTFSDDIPVIRYEEIVLIYAEALLRNNKAGDALTELNKIPANRGAAAYTVANMDNILLERRKELAFEGFRFDDLARTKKSLPLVDNVRQTYGNVAYGAYNYAFPIPGAEIGANSNVKQNTGY